MTFSGNIASKLPATETTIFTIMSRLAAEHQAINLSQGFPDFSCQPALSALVAHFMSLGYNQYAPMPGVAYLREQVSAMRKEIHGVEYNPETEITITAGATQGIYIALSAFLHENDEVIIIEPAYDSYLPGILINKAKPVYYQMLAPDYTIDWKQVMKLITQRTRMIIINTPHNPTGTLLTSGDMQQLERMLKDTDILVLSDEVYEHITYDGQVHESASRYTDLRSRSIVVSSFGKTLHTTGWKVGYVLAPENLSNEFRKVFQYAQFSVSTPMQWAIAQFLEDPAQYKGLSAFYEAKRDLFNSYLTRSRFKPIPSRGTYFVCADYSGISRMSDRKFVERLTKDHKVAAIPVSAFYKNKHDQKVIRFCFAKSEETLHKAGEILCAI
ncbi:MAG: aminotransferase class I/II-fold pyridoxal phosphate-dependent enzyme [Bacteroidetes bacterium]|nr:aminotransferase class I/II-fold pyridoxal phosphate-dependent enzyme [Bacteroidota bacterium]